MKIGVVLAAGKSSRFKSSKPKGLHEIDGKSIIGRLLESFSLMNIDKVYIVVNRENYAFFQKENFEVGYLFQDNLNGGGGALYCLNELVKSEDQVIVINSDTYIYDKSILRKFYEASVNSKKDKSLIVVNEDLKGYGRIKVSEEGIKIIEEKELNGEQLELLNVGVYYFKGDYLLDNFSVLNRSDSRITYLLEGDSYLYQCSSLIRGINNKDDYMNVTKRHYLTICNKFLEQGVKIYDVNNTYIGENVRIEEDVEIYPNNYIFGDVEIGKNTVIYPNCYIENSKIGNECKIGPFSSIRENNKIGNNVVIGAYVEVKNSVIKDGVKSKHHAYLGNVEIGENGNVGCGVIIANYDGKKKNSSSIGKNVFVGSNVTIVSPVKIGNDVLLAAGSTIVNDVDDKMMVIAREREVYKKNPLIKKD